MNAVGIDVSKGKSMVAALRPFGEIVVKPFEVPHTSYDFANLQMLCIPHNLPARYHIHPIFAPNPWSFLQACHTL